jgi:transcriptional regulator with XRE-family HTH domain
MNEQQKREKQIKILQQNLLSIRKIAGWTAEQLGDKIGVTKQTISNLENGRTEMNFTQYIAIRSILDHEIETNKENEVLPQVITILLDKNDEINEEDYTKVKEAVDTVAASAAGGIAGAALTSAFTALAAPTIARVGLGLLGPIGLIGGAVAGSAYWLKKFLK